MRARELPAATERMVRKSEVKSRTVLSSKVTRTVRAVEVGIETGERLETSVGGASREPAEAVMETDRGRGRFMTIGP